MSCTRMKGCTWMRRNQYSDGENCVSYSGKSSVVWQRCGTKSSSKTDEKVETNREVKKDKFSR